MSANEGSFYVGEKTDAEIYGKTLMEAALRAYGRVGEKYTAHAEEVSSSMTKIADGWKVDVNLPGVIAKKQFHIRESQLVEGMVGNGENGWLSLFVDGDTLDVEGNPHPSCYVAQAEYLLKDGTQFLAQPPRWNGIEVRRLAATPDQARMMKPIADAVSSELSRFLVPHDRHEITRSVHPQSGQPRLEVLFRAGKSYLDLVASLHVSRAVSVSCVDDMGCMDDCSPHEHIARHPMAVLWMESLDGSDSMASELFRNALKVS